MRTRFFIFVILSIVSISSYAKKTNEDDTAQREQWQKEMYTAKREYIQDALSLTSDQKSKFFPIYDQMGKEILKMQRETNQMRRSISRRTDVTDIEYEKASEALFELKSKEGALEMKYYNEFKTILTPQQLFKLKDAEFKWFRKIAKKRHSIKDK